LLWMVQSHLDIQQTPSSNRQGSTRLSNQEPASAKHAGYLIRSARGVSSTARAALPERFTVAALTPYSPASFTAKEHKTDARLGRPRIESRDWRGVMCVMARIRARVVGAYLVRPFYATGRKQGRCPLGNPRVRGCYRCGIRGCGVYVSR
jgi:hypothetical protein